MRFRTYVPLIACVVVALACQQEPADEAAAAQGAQPALSHPVGPVPGPDKATNLPPNPYENDPVALARGHQLFVQYNCSGCHGDHGGGGMGPSLRDAHWRYGGAPAQIFNTIAYGRIGMPSWGTKLSDQQIWQLAAYIKSMRTPNEPDPPTP